MREKHISSAMQMRRATKCVAFDTWTLSTRYYIFYLLHNCRIKRENRLFSSIVVNLFPYY